MRFGLTCYCPMYTGDLSIMENNVLFLPWKEFLVRLWDGKISEQSSFPPFFPISEHGTALDKQVSQLFHAVN